MTSHYFVFLPVIIIIVLVLGGSILKWKRTGSCDGVRLYLDEWSLLFRK